MRSVVLSNAPMAVVTSELTKIGSLTSVKLCLSATLLGNVLLGYLVATAQRTDVSASTPSGASMLVRSGVAPLLYGQVGLIVFGVLLVTGEYTTRMIRISLTAVPVRGLLLAAKVVAGALAVVAVSVPMMVLTLAAARTGLRAADSWAQLVMVRVILGGALYLTLIALISAGVAVILRSVVGSLAVMIPLVTTVSQLLVRIPVTEPAARYLPDQAGLRMLPAAIPAPGLSELQGLLVILAWAVAVLGTAYAVLRHRDA